MKKFILILLCLLLTGCQSYFENLRRQQEAEYSFYQKRYGLSRDEVDYLKQKEQEAQIRAANERYQRYLEEEGARIRDRMAQQNRPTQTNCVRNGDYINCTTY